MIAVMLWAVDAGAGQVADGMGQAADQVRGASPITLLVGIVVLALLWDKRK